VRVVSMRCREYRVHVRICANKLVASVRDLPLLRNIRLARTRVIALVRHFSKLEGLAPARA